MKIAIILFALIAACSSSLEAQVVVEYNGTDIVLKDADKKLYKVGQSIEMTRERRGNDMKTLTPWKLNESPVLEQGKNYELQKSLKPCSECVLGQIVMYHEYARVKVKRIV